MNESGRSGASPDWLQQIDHTADIGIVVQAENLQKLFERAAWGMFSVITDVPNVRADGRERITVRGEDRADLLLRWLSELNFRHIIDHRLFARFQVESLSERELTAEVWGERIDLERHTIYTEIKAVTFHGLAIEQKEGGWEARIIFDM